MGSLFFLNLTEPWVVIEREVRWVDCVSMGVVDKQPQHHHWLTVQADGAQSGRGGMWEAPSSSWMERSLVVWAPSWMPSRAPARFCGNERIYLLMPPRWVACYVRVGEGGGTRQSPLRLLHVPAVRVIVAWGQSSSRIPPLPQYTRGPGQWLCFLRVGVERIAYQDSVQLDWFADPRWGQSI